MQRTCDTHGLLPRYLKLAVSHDYAWDKPYGDGHTRVRKGEWLGQDVAVKVVKTNRGWGFQFFKEVATWKSLQHPNIMPLIGIQMPPELVSSLFKNLLIRIGDDPLIPQQARDC